MKKILNILLGVLLAITVVLTVWAIATGGAPAGGYSAALSVCIWWTYALLLIAVLTAIFCAVFGMIQNPAGVKGTVLSLGLIIVIVGIAYFYSASHTVEIANVSSGGNFGPGETLLTETGVIVTYVSVVVAFVTAVATEIWSAFK